MAGGESTRTAWPRARKTSTAAENLHRTKTSISSSTGKNWQELAETPAACTESARSSGVTKAR
jgi:hypothetical protein